MLFKIDHGNIYYETSEDIASTQKPILFVLPGGPGVEHSTYKFHSPALEHLCCLVYHDPRGCGKSTGFDIATATMENYIRDIEALRRHLNIEKLSILGTSYGSMCAMGYAILHSHNIHKLILVAGAPSHHFLETAKKNLEQRGNFQQKQVARPLWDANFKSNEQVNEFMRVMKSLYSCNPEYIQQSNTSDHYSFSVDVLNFGFKTFLRTFDFRAQLDKILCPTLILAGKQDWINDPVHLQEAAAKIPDCQLEIIENCGHLVAVDQRESYLRFIKQFLFRSLM